MTDITKNIRRVSGFTLLETMVAAALGLIVLASILATFIVFAQGSASVGAYVEMSQDSRKCLEIFSRDIRSSEDITFASTTAIIIEYPNNTFYSGESVTYSYEYDAFDEEFVFRRIMTDTGGAEISNEKLLSNVSSFNFKFYGPTGVELVASNPSLLLSIKSVQIDSVIKRSVSQTEATDYIISARFMMRNRALTI